MSWTIFHDENIKIEGTSNGYFTVFVYDETSNLCSSFDVENPKYFRTLSKAFETAAIGMDVKGSEGV